MYQVATTHMLTDPALKGLNQPDVMTLHLQFIRPCVVQESTVVVSALKTGKTTSNLQLSLYQDDILRALALVTTANFDSPLGPSIASSSPNLHPTPFPKPDFSRILANQPDEYWLPSRFTGDLIAGVSGTMLMCRPRYDYDVTGFSDGWHVFKEGQAMDGARLALLGDFVPSMSQTFLGTGLPSDDKAHLDKVRAVSKQSPGVPVAYEFMITEMMKSKEIEQTMSLSYEFKRRLPKEGLGWVYKRIQAGLLENGRVDATMSVLNQDLELLMTCRHFILSMGSSRKYANAKASL